MSDLLPFTRRYLNVGTVYEEKGAQGAVYFIGTTAWPARVKIGWTSGHPRKRVSALQTGNPDKLHLLAWFPSPQHVEGILHKELAHLRLDGEWFALKSFALAQFMLEARQKWAV